MVGKKVTSDLRGGFHFDKALNQSLLSVIANYVPFNFSWNKF